ncbi:MAG: beta-galactosidase [Anaerolineae bacterium]
MLTTADKWRIWLLLLAICTLLIALVGLVFRYLIHARASVVESAPPRLIPNTDFNPFGANFFLQWEAEPFKRAKTVEMAAQAGIGWAKQQFPWDDIEPSPGQYRWDKYDDIVNLYRKHGLQVIARLDRPPDWTREDNRFPERPPDDFNDYGDFVEELVHHFKDRVRYIQIWNEPNIFPEWGDQPVDPAAYTQLLGVAYRSAKSVDPNIYVLSAPLAINLEDFPARRNLSDLVFLEEMYQAGAADYFDILSANAFGMDRRPEDSPDPDVLNFRRVELQREIMLRYGDGDKPIWFDEYGWNAAPENFPPDKLIWQRVSEEQQARWTVEGIRWARAHWPWAGVFNIWYFRQIGNLSPNRADYYFRMVDVDFTPRRVYYAVQQATLDVNLAHPGYHQETAPAVTADNNWRPRIEPQASARADIVASARGATLTFTFSGTGVDLIAHRGPEGGQLAATIDGKPVPGLLRDGDGRSIVDLTASQPTWQSRTTLARDLPAGRHTLRLTLVVGEAAIDGFVVPLDNTPTLPLTPIAGCVFGLVAAGWFLYREVARITQV